MGEDVRLAVGDGSQGANEAINELSYGNVIPSRLVDQRVMIAFAGNPPAGLWTRVCQLVPIVARRSPATC
jgi:hypothetical protein